MVPKGLTTPSRPWAYAVGEVRVLGPAGPSISPPILAVAFQQALEHALQRVGVIDARTSPCSGFVLEADISRQQQSGDLSHTRQSLTVQYRVLAVSGGVSVWETSITTRSDMDDWKVDACTRRRRLQEQTVRDNIQRLIDALPVARP